MSRADPRPPADFPTLEALHAALVESAPPDPVAVTRERWPLAFGPWPGYLTVHPSYLLRLADEDSRAAAYAAFLADLRAAGDLARASERRRTASRRHEVDVEIAIQAAGPEHFPALRRIELAAFETLRAAGAVQGAPVASADQALQDYLGDNLLLAAFAGDAPVGFGGGRVIADALHICEMDVHPDWQRRGIGRRILAALLDAGRRRHLVRATLTTDRWAPFNAPFYAALGFQLAAGADCPRWLADRLREEVEQGLDPRRRVAMQLML